MTDVQAMTAFHAFESQLKTLCLQEFPCGIGRWKENYGKKRKQIEKDKVSSRFVVTLKDYGSPYEKTEALEEFITSKHSPWNLDYSWSSEAKQLREIAVRSPWLIDQKFVLGHFKTLRIVDKNVTEIDEQFLKFVNLEELSLTANQICTINSRNLPDTLTVLELCANKVSTLADLCLCPPPRLTHLGLGYNCITLVEDFITGEYWPNLLSVDLSHNDLTDMMDIVRKLQTLPKLRNLLLQGNPLALIPGYRGYVIDSLRKISFLDDIGISADEKHHFKGLAKRKEIILDEAKMVFHVSYIKGVLMPEELKNPDEQPEYPVVNRKYFVQFMYVKDRSTSAEIFQIQHDDQLSERSTSTHPTPSPTLDTKTMEGEVPVLSQGGVSVVDKDNETQQDVPTVVLTGPVGAVLPEKCTGSRLSVDDTTTSSPVLEEGTDHTRAEPPGVSLGPIDTPSCTWMEEMEVDWTKTLARDDLLAVRDFLRQGMTVHVVEEKILSFPAEPADETAASPVPSSIRGKDGKDAKQGKADKKPDKKDDKVKGSDKAKGSEKGPDKKGKKKGDPEVELVAMPPEYSRLATFHVPLVDFLDGEFEFENVFTYTGCQDGNSTPDSEVSSRRSQDKKDTKKPGSAKKKDAKAEKDTRVKSAKKDKKEDKIKKPEGGRGEGDEDGLTTPPPPLEIHVRVKLVRWRTATDSMQDDEGAEPPDNDPETVA